MKIFKINENKKQYLSLLLIGDEQESMIDKYLERGVMFALYDDGVKAVCVVTNEGNSIIEIKNIAVKPQYQRMGYGRKLIEFISENYKNKYSFLQAGTGDSDLTVPFYEKCGFKRSHIKKNFFTDNYNHPIYENGKLLTDMIYFRKNLQD
jgi:ribosomal protein S18 acetylase RimI-like enzyme